LGRATVALAAAALVLLAEVGLRRGLDPVRTLAEVDRVQVLGEDLVLGPFPLEVVGERGLAELLEDRSGLLRLERVLHELLGDGGGALDRVSRDDVLDHGAGDAEDVDAAVVVEALVLDRHDGLLHRRRDVGRLDEDPGLVAREGRDRTVVAVGHHRVLGGQVLLAVLQPGEVGGDRHHDPEDEGDEGEHAEPEQHHEQAELLEPGPVARLLAAKRQAQRAARRLAVAVPIARAGAVRAGPVRAAPRERVAGGSNLAPHIAGGSCHLPRSLTSRRERCGACVNRGGLTGNWCSCGRLDAGGRAAREGSGV
jgi:hypothetical protein